MDIGAKGLAEVNLTIPQGTSLHFEVIHTDEEGAVIDHSASTVKMALQGGGGSYDLSEWCTGGHDSIVVDVPGEATKALPIGKQAWDMIVLTSGGGSIRMCYGSAKVVDTYALDGE